MPNPLLSPESMNAAAGRDENRSGWAAPDPQWLIGPEPGVLDPVTRWHGGLATASGAASATLMLLLLLVASGTFTWFATDTSADGTMVNFPTGWVIGGVVVGLVAVLVAQFKPHASRWLAPVYAVAEGVVLGAISRAFETAYDGIVLQAVGATLGVFTVMLLMYRAGLITVNARYRRIVMGATLGVLGFYVVSWVIGLFGSTPSYMTQGTGLGIVVSLVVTAVAAANLALDFDLIDTAEREKMPAYMEWYCAMGLLVTLVWLYMEMLRLLAKLRDN
ncbi:MAG: Bax inhibitor-1/YccA family protein [Acidimicrobiales bacterium]